MKNAKSLYHGHRFRAAGRRSSVARYAGIDVTLRVNRDIGFQVVASTHEFPEGGAAVSLDGGSHFCRYLDRKLVRWAQRKYKTLRRHKRRSEEWLHKMKQAYPRQFAHWQYLRVQVG
jgi:hypothetical protein